MFKTFLILIIAASSCINAYAQTNTSNDKPPLVVGIVIDQMRWDFLHQFTPYFGEGGFKRLMQKGFSYEQTFIPFTPSLTAAGHASIYTGAYPAMHGIVSNNWYDRGNESKQYCTSDTAVKSVGGSRKGGQMSPIHLMTTTVGDELRLFSGFRSRVYGVGIKDRGSIIPAGRSANGAFWFDDSTGNMISSTYYYSDLPSWVKSFNQKKFVDSMMAKPWNPLDKDVWISPSAKKNDHKRALVKGQVPQFPYLFKTTKEKGYHLFRYIPASNTYTVMFAESLLQQEQLGKKGFTDMLCISFPATDYAGHEFGPQSPEITDMYIRLDRDIARLLSFLDNYIGEKNYLTFLTADHAAPHSPSYLSENNLSAGGVDFYGMDNTVDSFLQATFGAKGLLVDYYGYQFYLNNKRIDSLKLNPDVVYDTLIQFLLKMPEVVKAIHLKKLHEEVLPSVYKEMIASGYYHRRSGDIQVVLKSHYVEYTQPGTEHGSLYNYDTRVPMIWYGWKVPPGRSFRRVNITDIAPTLSQMLWIDTPGASVGEVMVEVLAP